MRIALSVAVLMLLAQTASAAIIIHEPYNGYDVGSLVGQAPNGNTTGLNTAGTYAASINSGFNYTATGMTFGSGATTLQTSGGALSVSRIAGASLSGPILLSGAYTGTLYESYLYQIVSAPNANQNTFRQSISSDTASNNQRFRSDTVSGSNSSNVVGAAYIESTPTNGTGSAAVGVTYIGLTRSTRVGQTINGSTPGVTTFFLLDEAQFNNFKTGGLTDAELDAAGVGPGAAQVTGKATDSATSGTNALGASGLFYQVASAGGSSTELVSLFDEIRYGDSFDAVTPVPEPSSLLLAGAGLLALGAVARRRQVRR